MANLLTIIQNNKLKNFVVFNNFVYHKNNSYSEWSTNKQFMVEIEAQCSESNF
jgi:hypothetical protein